MSQLTEFHKLVLTALNPTMGKLTESSLAIRQVRPRFTDFIKQLHRNGFLLDRQQLSQPEEGEPSFTQLKPSTRRERWRYSSESQPNYIIWGDKNAALVRVHPNGYYLYVLNPETNKLEKQDFTKVSEFKSKLKGITGKILSFSKLELPKNFASKLAHYTMPSNEWDALTRKERQRYNTVLAARKDGKTSGDDELTQNKTIYTLPDLTARTSQRLKPLLARYMNRALGNILDMASAKINNFKKPQGGTHRTHSVEISELLERARMIKNYLLFLQDEDVQSDDKLDLTALLNNSIMMAAAEKYPDEVVITGFPGRLGRTRYPGSDALHAQGDGLRKFYQDLGAGNAQDLSLVMRWIGRLL